MVTRDKVWINSLCCNDHFNSEAELQKSFRTDTVINVLPQTFRRDCGLQTHYNCLAAIGCLFRDYLFSLLKECINRLLERKKAVVFTVIGHQRIKRPVRRHWSTIKSLELLNQSPSSPTSSSVCLLLSWAFFISIRVFFTLSSSDLF